MRVKNIYDFRTYRAYLKFRVKMGPRGTATAISRHLNVKPAFVSQVLSKKGHLSQEQAEKLNGFLHHGRLESRYFLLILNKERAGTRSLQKFYDGQINEEQKSRLNLLKRVGALGRVNEDQAAIYYSSWTFGAIHIALSLPRIKTATALSQKLQLPLELVRENLNFLCQAGLVEKAGDAYKVLKPHLRLGRDRGYILNHHRNWRLRSLKSLQEEDLRDLHYSGVIPLSKADAISLKDRLLEMIKDHTSIIKSSSEETLFNYNIDFYKIAKF